MSAAEGKKRAVRLSIQGRVQGVGYRAWAVQEAARHGLRGWVRNRSDGSVEALLVGDPDAVSAMNEACHSGPRAARVVSIDVSEAADDGSAGFTAKPTL